MIDEQVDRAAIQENLTAVQSQIARAAQQSGRSADAVHLVAVSKSHPFAAIAAAYEAGQRDFGENRLEELWPKIQMAQEQGLDAIRWHLIGTIQSRKTSQAVGPIHLIHSVERMKIAQRLSRASKEAGIRMDILLEVNVSGEESKHGFGPQAVQASATEIAALPGIRVRGLMTMAPLVENPEEARPVFRGLCELRNQLRTAYPNVTWDELSMGMTNDFVVAIQEGATMVRIGSAIFGARVY